MIRVWLDADSAPVILRDYIVNYCVKNGCEVIFVANRSVSAKKSDFKMIVCEAKKDSADNYIFENASSGDLVITKDLTLANRLLGKEILAINDKGVVYSKSYIETHLAEREMNMDLSALGFGSSKSDYSEISFKKFRKNFENCIEKLKLSY